MNNNPLPDRRRSDPASRLAYFLHEYKAPEGLSKEERHEALRAEISKHFPDVTDDQLVRGFEISTELLHAEAAEMTLKTVRLEAELRRRKAAHRRQG